MAIFNAPEAGKSAVPTSQEAAQFHCIHLLRVMVKLLPNWLPEALFKVLQERWHSSQRLVRCIQLFCSKEFTVFATALRATWGASVFCAARPVAFWAMCCSHPVMCCCLNCYLVTRLWVAIFARCSLQCVAKVLALSQGLKMCLLHCIASFVSG